MGEVLPGELAVYRVQSPVRLWGKNESLNPECRSGFTGEGHCFTIPCCYPRLQHEEWMRASDKEQGTIPDHPGTQKWAVAKVSVHGAVRGHSWKSRNTCLCPRP